MIKIFSGDESREMWAAINTAETVEDLRAALYTVCCRLQILESQIRMDDIEKVKKINDFLKNRGYDSYHIPEYIILQFLYFLTDWIDEIERKIE